ncbi:hypothetical protein BAE44_0020499 [Dichanthelium oligosanthes]|uniref:DUF1618 domain-containing protein n=1 Tax=Dichanthelium oligosanthes TaxID=888268 RepID=A0A1E5UZZ5_9POAL|nr:hypothetical protein BAE44_0020499 [Dichanthelium oligosanthes]
MPRSGRWSTTPPSPTSGPTTPTRPTGLPEKAPVLALIHPHNPAVVYFFLEGHLFAVDVAARRVVECDRYHLVAPPRDYGIPNRFVSAWELPRSVSSELGNWSSDIGPIEPAEAERTV